jgi:hypothetical protein
MREIMPQVMKAQFSNQLLMTPIRLAFEGAEPVMDARLGEMGITLQREDIGADLIAPAVLKIVVEGRRASLSRSMSGTSPPCVQH